MKNKSQLIHFIWLGGELSELANYCIDRAAIVNPEHEVKVWRDEDFDDPRIEKLIQMKRYAFASDIGRFQILAKFGGIYLDADVELVKPVDHLPDDFVCAQDPGVPNTAAMGCSQGAEWVSDALDLFDRYDIRNIPSAPNFLRELGKVRQLPLILPSEVFYPYYPNSVNELRRFPLVSNLTLPEVVGVHHWAGSWEGIAVRTAKKIQSIIRSIRP